MRIVATSDLHGFIPSDEELPEGDLLVIAGDIMGNLHEGHSQEEQRAYLEVFDKFLERQNLRYTHGVIGVAGNHDFLFDKNSIGKTFLGQYNYQDAGSSYPESLDWTYLFDRSVEIGGLIFYGTPYVPNLASWAFYSPESDTRERFAQVASADVIVSHGPPFGYGDLTARQGVRAGSEEFLRALSWISPRAVICGHIHEAYGSYRFNNTMIHNVSYVNLGYEPANRPVVIDL